MRTEKSVGRIIGVLLFFQLIGLSLPFILLGPATVTGYLETAAGFSTQVTLAVLLLFANAVLTIGIAIAGFPVFKERSYRMALWLFAFSVIWFAVQTVDNAHLLSMLSLSERYVATDGTTFEMYNILGSALRSSRRWIHYSELLVIDFWFACFYAIFFRFSLVPRVLAGFGLLAVGLHTAGITLSAFLGYSPIMSLGFSLLISHLAVGAWLAIKGFQTTTLNDIRNEGSHSHENRAIA